MSEGKITTYFCKCCGSVEEGWEKLKPIGIKGNALVSVIKGSVSED